MNERISDKMRRLSAKHEKENPAAKASPKSGAAGLKVAQRPEDTIKAADAADEQRRARTHRLVQIGAICDNYMGTRGMPPEKAMELLAQISRLEEARRIIARNK